MRIDETGGVGDRGDNGAFFGKMTGQEDIVFAGML